MRPVGSPFRRLLATALFLAVLVAGCGGHHRRATPTRHPAAARLTGPHGCQRIAGFTCAWLTVPLDHAGGASGTLRLAVGVQQVAHPPRGVLLFLTGGPGQPGIPLIPRVMSRLGAALHGYRLVMMDQRGTGAAALRCPALQSAAGSSDLAIVTSGAVSGCARAIGPARRYFTTPETVADIEALRIALGADRLTLDGVSYGTYVAERYALTHRPRVQRLVLDSVVPQQGVDAPYLAALQATAGVLRDACVEQRCRWDPPRDVRTVVNDFHDGPELLKLLVAESVVAPSYRSVLRPLHAAAAGRPQALNRLLAAVSRAEGAPAEVLSQGLHESTLCLDLASPWNPAAPASERRLTLAREVRRIAARSLFPFDQATASGNGIASGCLAWPSTRLPAVMDGDPSADLPPVPVLLLAGERDLSTPVAWAREEAAKAPRGELVIVPGAGHSVQTRAHNPSERSTLLRFLAGRE